MVNMLQMCVYVGMFIEVSQGLSMGTCTEDNMMVLRQRQAQRGKCEHGEASSLQGAGCRSKDRQRQGWDCI